MLVACQHTPCSANKRKIIVRTHVRVALARAISSSSSAGEQQLQQQQPSAVEAPQTSPLHSATEPPQITGSSAKAKGSGAKRFRKWQQRKKLQQASAAAAAAAVPGPASIPRSCHTPAAVCDLLHRYHTIATPAFWVKALVHLVRLASKTDGQQIAQAGWRQLKECLMFLVQQQQQQQQQQWQQQGEAGELLLSFFQQAAPAASYNHSI
jgi:hypothetical protein